MGLSHIHNKYPTDDMNNRIRVGILQRPDNLCYSGQCVNE